MTTSPTADRQCPPWLNLDVIFDPADLDAIAQAHAAARKAVEYALELRSTVKPVIDLYNAKAFTDHALADTEVLRSVTGYGELEDLLSIAAEELHDIAFEGSMVNPDHLERIRKQWSTTYPALAERVCSMQSNEEPA